ncbi:MAG: cell division protein SepF [Candidatus Aenigmatarchaeota archaeon]
MVIKKIVEKLKGKKVEEEGEVEILPEEEEQKVRIFVRKINEYSEVENVLNLLRANNIVVISIRELRKRDMAELKRVVDRIKRTVEAIGGDIVGVEEDLIIATPSIAKIER